MKNKASNVYLHPRVQPSQPQPASTTQSLDPSNHNTTSFDEHTTISAPIKSQLRRTMIYSTNHDDFDFVSSFDRDTTSATKLRITALHHRLICRSPKTHNQESACCTCDGELRWRRLMFPNFRTLQTMLNRL